jgi:hypothetical protein
LATSAKVEVMSDRDPGIIYEPRTENRQHYIIAKVKDPRSDRWLISDGPTKFDATVNLCGLLYDLLDFERSITEDKP